MTPPAHTTSSACMGFLTSVGLGILSSLFTPGPLLAGTTVEIIDGRWHINGQPTHPGSPAEGLLMNVRMVNATYEDRSGQRPDFNPDQNTNEFLTQLQNYKSHGVNAFTLCLQGGMPGYEGAINSAFEPDGRLRPDYLNRVSRVIRACDQQGLVVILGCYYQRQSKILNDDAALRAGLVNVCRWIESQQFTNVVLEVANEYPHKGFAHQIIRNPQGQASLIRLVKETAPQLLVTSSGYGDGRIDPDVASACDFLTPHWNGTKSQDIPARIAALKAFGKPIVCNEDDKVGEDAVAALTASVASGAGYGLMLKDHNQSYPFSFDGAQDDPVFYAALKQITSSPSASLPVTFPPPESQGGWPTTATSPLPATVDSQQLEELRTWLLESDRRDFAAVVIHQGTIVLQVERGNSAVTDTRNIKSCAKAICATVLAIASQQSQNGETPHVMKFDDPAFNFIPWAQPLSDPRKARITVRQLLNHTSGITPESTKIPNRGPWEFILGHTGDDRNQRLAFDPGTDLDYGTQSFYHASLVCEHVTGQPYHEYTIDNLFTPLGIENWWFEIIDGDDRHGKHPSHALGLSARDMARIGYCMMHHGRWGKQQIIPPWFIDETARPTHSVPGTKTFGRSAQSFSHGWELPGLLDEEKSLGIPQDARFKPGSGGQLIAFVPSLDLVITRQTGGSGAWDYEGYLRRACACIRSSSTPSVEPSPEK